MNPRIPAVFLALGLGLSAAHPALAWGDKGHRIVGTLAVESLPAELPAFLRTKQAAADVGEMARELDRSKGAGRIHDSDRDPGHFADLDDDARLLGGPKLVDLPPTRAAYETALRAVGQDSWKAGYLPYAIVDGHQQLVRDFATYRVLLGAVKREKNRTRLEWYKADLRRRELLILRDVGVWAHYLGDGAQPLHDTIHYNGWDSKTANPQGFTTDRIHGPFEEDFVRDHVDIEMVRRVVPAPRDCACTAEKRMIDYLLTGHAQVAPLYQMWKAGDFTGAAPKGTQFVVTRLAAGSAELRDMIVSAWQASARATTRYRETEISPAQAASGERDAWGALHGNK